MWGKIGLCNLSINNFYGLILQWPTRTMCHCLPLYIFSNCFFELNSIGYICDASDWNTCSINESSPHFPVMTVDSWWLLAQPCLSSLSTCFSSLSTSRLLSDGVCSSVKHFSISIVSIQSREERYPCSFCPELNFKVFYFYFFKGYNCHCHFLIN